MIRALVRGLVILVLCVPLSAVTTLLLLPLWNALENHWQIESVGHSGPADWCFIVVYALWVAACGGAAAWLGESAAR